MTVLTRVMIDSSRRPALRALASPNALHGIVSRAFTTAPGAGERVLWRLDTGTDRHKLYVVSDEVPDTSHLEREFGTDPGAAETHDYDGFLGRLRSGQEWRFRLRANPTKTVPTAVGKRSERRGIHSEPEQLAWLLRKAESAGFAIPTNRIGVPEAIARERATLRFRRESAEVTLATAAFDGILTVADADALRTALRAGIGRGKAYGCGLLTLAPLD